MAGNKAWEVVSKGGMSVEISCLFGHVLPCTLLYVNSKISLSLPEIFSVASDNALLAGEEYCDRLHSRGFSKHSLNRSSWAAKSRVSPKFSKASCIRLLRCNCGGCQRSGRLYWWICVCWVRVHWPFPTAAPSPSRSSLSCWDMAA